MLVLRNWEFGKTFILPLFCNSFESHFVTNKFDTETFLIWFNKIKVILRNASTVTDNTNCPTRPKIVNSTIETDQTRSNFNKPSEFQWALKLKSLLTVGVFERKSASLQLKLKRNELKRYGKLDTNYFLLCIWRCKDVTKYFNPLLSTMSFLVVIRYEKRPFNKKSTEKFILNPNGLFLKCVSSKHSSDWILFS